MIYDVCVGGGASDWLQRCSRKGRSLSLVIERMDKTGKKISGNGQWQM